MSASVYFSQLTALLCVVAAAAAEQPVKRHTQMKLTDARSSLDQITNNISPMPDWRTVISSCEPDWKMEEFLTFNAMWPWPWPWIGPYGIPSCITPRPLVTYQISFESETFCGRTNVRTDRHQGRLYQVDLEELNKELATAGEEFEVNADH